MAQLVNKQFTPESSPEAAQRGETPTWSSYPVLGVRVHAVQIPDVISRMEDWISSRNNCHFIAVMNAHSVVEARRDASFKEVLNSADLAVPDGMPLVWLGRLRGYLLRHRVYGPDLFLSFCQATREKGYGHFLYGGAHGVSEKLAEGLRILFPSIKVVGTYSPPFRCLTSEEERRVTEMINNADPQVLWVGLGCPKQERWMYEHRNTLRVPVMVGIGQAFDIYTGRLRQAPRWMREHGLEWSFRLMQEPGRLWRRYLFYNAQFIYCTLLELAGLKHFD